MAAAREDLNLPLIVTIGILFVVLLFVLILLLQAYFYESERREHYTKVVAMPSEELAAALAEQEQLLRGYRWIDQPQGIVGLPIERAMELVVRDGVKTLNRPVAPAESAPPGEQGSPAGDS